MINHYYVFDNDLPPGAALDIHEDRGTVVYRISPDLTPSQILRALNAGAEAVLSGGRWFQEWHGDIVTRANPTIPSQGIPLRRSRVHRTGEYGAA